MKGILIILAIGLMGCSTYEVDRRYERSAQRGPEGKAGPQGEVGPRGEKGDQGNEGPVGNEGRDGEDGLDGLDGNNGNSPEIVRPCPDLPTTPHEEIILKFGEGQYVAYFESSDRLDSHRLVILEPNTTYSTFDGRCIFTLEDLE